MEQLLTLSDAAKLIPGRKGCLSVGTLRRWIATGLDGIKLEAVRAGGRVCVSEQAMRRFVEACTSRRYSPPPTPPRRQRQREPQDLNAIPEI